MKSFQILFLILLVPSTAAKKPPTNPFEESPDQSDGSEEEYEVEYEDDSTSQESLLPSTTEQPRPRIHAARVTHMPVTENILYTLMPTLQQKTYRYCPLNQQTFATTCRPGKKLRYDLQVFCQEYSDYCGVPNIHLMQSRNPYQQQEEYRPAGYGQKQKDGHLGLGRSFGFGLGAIPGFEVVASNGADVGKLPGLPAGGLMFNEGTDIGMLGERTGRAPARTMASLSRGFPSFGKLPGTERADLEAIGSMLRAFGVPTLGGGGAGAQKPLRPLFEPGYDAVDKKVIFATGKTDGKSIDLPGGLGNIALYTGQGMGIG